MSTGKKDKKQNLRGKTEADLLLWRKPITLDLSAKGHDDPLTGLYRGSGGRGVNVGESGDIAPATQSSGSEEEEELLLLQQNLPTEAGRNSESLEILEKVDEQFKYASKIKGSSAKTGETSVHLQQQEHQQISRKNTLLVTSIDRETQNHLEKAEISASANPKINERELKSILKIKTDESFNFTDLREILRGTSFEIYAFLCLLSGNSGVCKIKHLDLMRKLNISRPTLFKQTDWLIRLCLIEKQSVPGDHLGTTYKINRLADVLPIPAELINQLESHINNLEQIYEKNF